MNVKNYVCRGSAFEQKQIVSLIESAIDLKSNSEVSTVLQILTESTSVKVVECFGAFHQTSLRTKATFAVFGLTKFPHPDPLCTVYTCLPTKKYVYIHQRKEMEKE